MAKKREEVIHKIEMQADPLKKKNANQTGLGGIKNMFEGITRGFLK